MGSCSEAFCTHLAAEASLAVYPQVQRWWQRPTQTRRSVFLRIGEATLRLWSTVRWIHRRPPALIQVRWVHWRLPAALRQALQADQVYLMCPGSRLPAQTHHCPTPVCGHNCDKQASSNLLNTLLQLPCGISQQHPYLPAETGLLRFNWGNICMHYFSVPFLTRMAQQLQQQGRYHIAHKTIPSKDGPVKVGSWRPSYIQSSQQLAASHL